MNGISVGVIMITSKSKVVILSMNIEDLYHPDYFDTLNIS